MKRIQHIVYLFGFLLLRYFIFSRFEISLFNLMDAAAKYKWWTQTRSRTLQLCDVIETLRRADSISILHIQITTDYRHFAAADKK